MAYVQWVLQVTYQTSDTVIYDAYIYQALSNNTNVIPLGHPLIWTLIGPWNSGGGGGTYTFTSGGPGTSLVSLLSTTTDFKPVTLSAGTGVTLISSGTDILISAGAAGGNMNYVGPGTTPGQHYIANDPSGLNANNSALIEDADKVAFNGERILLTTPTSPFINGDYAIYIRDFNNNVGDQYGLWIRNTSSSVQDTIPIYVVDTQSQNNSYGAYFDTINAKNASYGIYMNKINSDNTESYGSKIINISSTNGTATGYLVDTILANNNSALGFGGRSIKSDLGDARGLQLLSIISNAGGGAFGFDIEELISQDGKAYGGYILTVRSNNETATGIRMSDIKSANNTSTGIVISDVGDNSTSGKSADGIFVSNVTSGIGSSDLATAFNCNTIIGTGAYGLKGNRIAGTNEAYGSFILDISSPNLAVGHYIESIVSSATNAYGLYGQVLEAKNFCYGINFNDLNSISGYTYGCYFDTIHARGNATGYFATSINSDVGNSFGSSYTSISAGLSGFGSYISSVNGVTATGYYADKIAGSESNAIGVDLSNISSLGGEVRGVNMVTLQGRKNVYSFSSKSTVSTNQNAWGLSMDGISATIGVATGAEISRVSGPLGAYGANIHDVNCEAKDAYGIRVDTVNAPANNAYGCILTNITGSRQYGFYQQGQNLNVGNIFDAHTEIGSATLATDQPALYVLGSTNTKTQFFTAATATATVNGGNIIICSGTTITTLNMPTSPPDGLTYTVWKPSTLLLTINGNTHLINGVGSQTMPIASIAAPQNATITYSSNLGQWLFHLN